MLSSKGLREFMVREWAWEVREWAWCLPKRYANGLGSQKRRLGGFISKRYANGLGFRNISWNLLAEWKLVFDTIGAKFVALLPYPIVSGLVNYLMHYASEKTAFVGNVFPVGGVPELADCTVY